MLVCQGLPALTGIGQFARTLAECGPPTDPPFVELLALWEAPEWEGLWVAA